MKNYISVDYALDVCDTCSMYDSYAKLLARVQL